MKHILKIYPVENGDTTLIKLDDNTTIQIDCKLRVGAEDPDDDSKFDVKADLLKEVQNNGKYPFINTFILTHPDKDHCHGFGNHYFQGDPKDYKKANLDNNEVVINELWVTSILFTTDQSDDANAVRNEANRRIKLWDSNDPAKDLPGNRIVLVGYDANGKFKNVPNYVPGTMVTKFDGNSTINFEAFVHAPFKDDLVTCKAEGDRNSASIVLQLVFKNDILKEVAHVLMGGDADHYNWKEVLHQSKIHGNLKALQFDVFLAPHHCSWTYFNDTPYDNDVNKVAKTYSIEILQQQKDGAYIVASSRKIVNAKPNPPHYAAMTEYVNQLKTKANFINTAILPNENAPEPIVFVIDSYGISLAESDTEKKKKIAAALAVASTSVIKKPYCSNE